MHGVQGLRFSVVCVWVSMVVVVVVVVVVGVGVGAILRRINSRSMATAAARDEL